MLKQEKYFMLIKIIFFIFIKYGIFFLKDYEIFWKKKINIKLFFFSKNFIYKIFNKKKHHYLFNRFRNIHKIITNKRKLRRNYKLRKNLPDLFRIKIKALNTKRLGTSSFNRKVKRYLRFRRMPKVVSPKKKLIAIIKARNNLIKKYNKGKMPKPRYFRYKRGWRKGKRMYAPLIFYKYYLAHKKYAPHLLHWRIAARNELQKLIAQGWSSRKKEKIARGLLLRQQKLRRKKIHFLKVWDWVCDVRDAPYIKLEDKRLTRKRLFLNGLTSRFSLYKSILKKKKFFAYNTDFKNLKSLIYLNKDLYLYNRKSNAIKFKFFKYKPFFGFKKMMKFYLKNICVYSSFFNYKKFILNFKQSFILKKFYFQNYSLNFFKLNVNSLYNYFLKPNFSERFFARKQFFSVGSTYLKKKNFKQHMFNFSKKSKNLKVNLNLFKIVESLSKKNFVKTSFVLANTRYNRKSFLKKNKYFIKDFLDYAPLKNNEKILDAIKKTGPYVTKNVIKEYIKFYNNYSSVYNSLKFQRRLYFNDFAAYKNYCKWNFFIKHGHNSVKSVSKFWFNRKKTFINSYVLYKKSFFKTKKKPSYFKSFTHIKKKNDSKRNFFLKNWEAVKFIDFKREALSVSKKITKNYYARELSKVDFTRGEYKPHRLPKSNKVYRPFRSDYFSLAAPLFYKSKFDDKFFKIFKTSRISYHIFKNFYKNKFKNFKKSSLLKASKYNAREYLFNLYMFSLRNYHLAAYKKWKNIKFQLFKQKRTRRRKWVRPYDLDIARKHWLERTDLFLSTKANVKWKLIGQFSEKKFIWRSHWVASGKYKIYWRYVSSRFPIKPKDSKHLIKRPLYKSIWIKNLSNFCALNFNIKNKMPITKSKKAAFFINKLNKLAHKRSSSYKNISKKIKNKIKKNNPSVFNTFFDACKKLIYFKRNENISKILIKKAFKLTPVVSYIEGFNRLPFKSKHAVDSETLELEKIVMAKNSGSDSLSVFNRKLIKMSGLFKRKRKYSKFFLAAYAIYKVKSKIFNAQTLELEKIVMAKNSGSDSLSVFNRKLIKSSGLFKRNRIFSNFFIYMYQQNKFRKFSGVPDSETLELEKIVMAKNSGSDSLSVFNRKLIKMSGLFKTTKKVSPFYLFISSYNTRNFKINGLKNIESEKKKFYNKLNYKPKKKYNFIKNVKKKSQKKNSQLFNSYNIYYNRPRFKNFYFLDNYVKNYINKRFVKNSFNKNNSFDLSYFKSSVTDFNNFNWRANSFVGYKLALIDKKFINIKSSVVKNTRFKIINFFLKNNKNMRAYFNNSKLLNKVYLFKNYYKNIAFVNARRNLKLLILNDFNIVNNFGIMHKFRIKHLNYLRWKKYKNIASKNIFKNKLIKLFCFKNRKYKFSFFKLKKLRAKKKKFKKRVRSRTFRYFKYNYKNRFYLNYDLEQRNEFINNDLLKDFFSDENLAVENNKSVKKSLIKIKKKTFSSKKVPDVFSLNQTQFNKLPALSYFKKEKHFLTKFLLRNKRYESKFSSAFDAAFFELSLKQHNTFDNENILENIKKFKKDIIDEKNYWLNIDYEEQKNYLETKVISDAKDYAIKIQNLKKDWSCVHGVNCVSKDVCELNKKIAQETEHQSYVNYLEANKMKDLENIVENIEAEKAKFLPFYNKFINILKIILIRREASYRFINKENIWVNNEPKFEDSVYDINLDGYFVKKFKKIFEKQFSNIQWPKRQLKLQEEIDLDRYEVKNTNFNRELNHIMNVKFNFRPNTLKIRLFRAYIKSLYKKSRKLRSSRKKPFRIIATSSNKWLFASRRSHSTFFKSYRARKKFGLPRRLLYRIYRRKSLKNNKLLYNFSNKNSFFNKKLPFYIKKLQFFSSPVFSENIDKFKNTRDLKYNRYPKFFKKKFFDPSSFNTNLLKLQNKKLKYYFKYKNSIFYHIYKKRHVASLRKLPIELRRVKFKRFERRTGPRFHKHPIKRRNMRVSYIKTYGDSIQAFKYNAFQFIKNALFSIRKKKSSVPLGYFAKKRARSRRLHDSSPRFVANFLRNLRLTRLSNILIPYKLIIRRGQVPLYQNKNKKKDEYKVPLIRMVKQKAKILNTLHACSFSKKKSFYNKGRYHLFYADWPIQKNFSCPWNKKFLKKKIFAIKKRIYLKKNSYFCYKNLNILEKKVYASKKPNYEKNRIFRVKKSLFFKKNKIRCDKELIAIKKNIYFRENLIFLNKKSLYPAKKLNLLKKKINAEHYKSRFWRKKIYLIEKKNALKARRTWFNWRLRIFKKKFRTYFNKFSIFNNNFFYAKNLQKIFKKNKLFKQTVSLAMKELYYVTSCRFNRSWNTKSYIKTILYFMSLYKKPIWIFNLSRFKKLVFNIFANLRKKRYLSLYIRRLVIKWERKKARRYRRYFKVFLRRTKWEYCIELFNHKNVMLIHIDFLSLKIRFSKKVRVNFYKVWHRMIFRFYVTCLKKKIFHFSEVYFYKRSIRKNKMKGSWIYMFMKQYRKAFKRTIPKSLPIRISKISFSKKTTKNKKMKR